MRRWMRACACLLGLFAGALPASAQLSLGLHIGFDLSGHAARSLDAAQLSDGTWVGLERGSIDPPLLGGLHLGYIAAPRLALELGCEGSLREVAVAYEHRAADNLSVLPGERFADEAVCGRLSLYGAAKLLLLAMPVVKVYAGAGLGYHRVAPLLSVERLERRIVAEGASGSALAPAELLAREGALGGQLLAGLHLRPNFLPLGLGVEGRYHRLARDDGGEERDPFVSLAFALELDL